LQLSSVFAIVDWGVAICPMLLLAPLLDAPLVLAVLQ